MPFLLHQTNNIRRVKQLQTKSSRFTENEAWNQILVTRDAGFGSLHIAREKATCSLKTQRGFSGIGKECLGGLFCFGVFLCYIHFRRSHRGAQCPAPAARWGEQKQPGWNPGWKPGWILAGILAECWCHLVRAGEVAGIFLQAVLFPCELP